MPLLPIAARNCVILASCLATSGAFAERERFYMGVVVGVGYVESQNAGLDFDADATSATASVGYRISQHFGVETGFVHFSNTNEQVGLINVENDLQGVRLLAVGYLPLGHPNYDLYAKLGVIGYNSHTRYSGSGGAFGVDDEGVELAWGLGGQWRWRDHWLMRLEVEGYSVGNLDDVWTVSGGVLYRTGGR